MRSKILARAAAPMLLGLLVVAATANAAEQKPAVRSPASINVQGVQVAIDPATGRLVEPTAEQRAALSRAMLEESVKAPAARAGLRRTAAPRNEAEAQRTLRTIRLKDGRTAMGMEVPENLMNDLLVERSADGASHIHHEGDTPQAAQEVTQ